MLIGVVTEERRVLQQLFEFLGTHPLSYFWIAADLVMLIVAIRFVLISARFRKKLLWVFAAILNPLLILVFGSRKFHKKILWAMALIFGGIIKINLGTPQYFHWASIPLNIYFSYGFSLGALLVLSAWMFLPEDRTTE